MPSLLIEVETCPTTFRPGEIGWDKDGNDKKYTEHTTIWESRLAIDLAWVAAVQPFKTVSGDASHVLMCGGSQWQIINIPYNQLMPKWCEAKGLPWPPA